MSQSNKTAWSGRFIEIPSHKTQEFGASLPIDKRMWREDIDGSCAHARMLAKIGVISAQDLSDIERGMALIASEIESGSFVWDIADEDVHMAIEKRLTELVGDAGARLHTGRSRNDQVALDARLYIKKRLVEFAQALLDLRQVLVQLARDNGGVYLPGYTHLQKAQPVAFGHHMLAYFEMFSRDYTRVIAALKASDVSPLGSAALAGTSYPLDREMVAAELGLSGVSANSLDAVSDRDFLLDANYASAVCMMHLSRLCEELIIWSTEEFGFIKMSDAYSTGSSIMPQKKNPDFAELIRGKSGRVYGNLVQLLTTLKALPLAYNKDMQEDKEAAFDSFDTCLASLQIMSGMLSTMEVRADRMKQGAAGGFSAATDVADYLVGKGIPFRNAHEIVGRLVLAAERKGRALHELDLRDFQEIDPIFDESVLKSVEIESVVNARGTYGGTSFAQVDFQVDNASSKIANDAKLLEQFGL